MINKLANKLNNTLVEMRRKFHRIPELEFEEFKTTELICKYLKEYDIEYEKILPTGICAEIKGTKGDNGKCILIRADIDALPMQENNSLSFKSEHTGKMHACGHDVHITALLGACIILKQMNFCGTVKAVFQPAEEGAGGALPMIENGVMKNPDVTAAVALHNEPMANVGTLLYRNSSIMASPDDFKIVINGVGGHGACPQLCNNPIYIASELITDLSGIVKNNFEDESKCVVSVCTVNAGTLNNIIPDTVEITGTARSLDSDTRTKIEELIYNTAGRVCNKHHCSFDYKFNKLYPPVVNSDEINNIVINASKKINGIYKISELEKASMTGDDFSYFAEIVPSSYFKLGSGNEKIKRSLHSSDFDIDESCLKLGAAVLAQTALDYLSLEGTNK